MEIRKKFTLIFLTLSIVPLISLALLTFNYARQSLLQETKTKLETIAKLQIIRINTVIDTYNSKLNLITTRTTFINTLGGLNKTNTKAKEQLNNFLETVLSSSDDIQII